MILYILILLFSETSSNDDEFAQIRKLAAQLKGRMASLEAEANQLREENLVLKKNLTERNINTRDVCDASIPETGFGWREIAESPRIYVNDNFATAEECDFVIQYSEQYMEPSDIGPGDPSSRNSSSALLPPYNMLPETMQKLIDRIHLASRIPRHFGETLQLVKYTSKNEYYIYHPDSFDGYDRSATFFVYLNDIGRGGETRFPKADGRSKKSVEHFLRISPDRFKKRCKSKKKRDELRIQAKQGRAILFFNHDLDGQFNEQSIHGGCPPLGDETKYILTRWMGFTEQWQRIPTGMHRKNNDPTTFDFG